MPTILVIDDSLHIRMLIRKFLETDKYKIVEAGNGAHTLLAVAAEAFDCIILDLIMPDIDGLNILKYLHEGNPKIPVIIVTAHLQDSIREHCLKFGAAAFINKPFTGDELRYTVKKVLADKVVAQEIFPKIDL